MSVSKCEPIFKICSKANAKTYRFDYQMVIDKFSIRMKDGFRSDLFSPPGLHELKFYIDCSMNQRNVAYKMISLFVCENLSNIYVKFNIKGLNEKDEAQFSNAPREFSRLSKSILLCELWNSNRFSGEKLTIICEFTFEIDSFATQTLLPSFEKSNSAKVKEFQGYHVLSKTQQTALDLDNMFQDAKFSDVEIVIGKRSFYAHKFMLAARSQVFAAMFEHDLVENRSNRVEIIDVDEEIFKHLLRYVYSNILPPNESNADELLAAADKYQLNELKAICEHRLISKLNDETMYDLLLLADTYNADKLKEAAIKYISSRFSGTNSPGFHNNSNSAITKLFENHLTGGLIEAMRNFDQDAKSKGLVGTAVKSPSPFGQ